jgi:hypothetical protein
MMGSMTTILLIIGAIAVLICLIDGISGRGL